MESKESSHFIKHESSPNTKHKRFFSNKFIPSKIPNKVGCINDKRDNGIRSPVNSNTTSKSDDSNHSSRSPTGTSSRPLSLHISSSSSKVSVCTISVYISLNFLILFSISVCFGQHLLQGELRRCSSASGDHVFQEPTSQELAPNPFIRSASHDSILHVKHKVSSMDSLARRALLAAQVLHLIPTNKARQRNYLQGRIAANSLLGSVELERMFPNRQVTIFVGTWNMNGQSPPR